MTPHTQSTGELEQIEKDLAGSFEQFRLAEGSYMNGTSASSIIAAQQFIRRMGHYFDKLIRKEAYRLAIEELEKAHRAGNTYDYDNPTDEYIDERLERLQSLIQEDAADE